MRYDFKNLKLEIINNTGTLYKNDKLMFKGDSYISIKMFLAESNNNEWIRNKFRAQLEMREHCRWKKQDEQLKSDQQTKRIHEKVKLSKK